MTRAIITSLLTQCLIRLVNVSLLSPYTICDFSLWKFHADSSTSLVECTPILRVSLAFFILGELKCTFETRSFSSEHVSRTEVMKFYHFFAKICLHIF